MKTNLEEVIVKLSNDLSNYHLDNTYLRVQLEQTLRENEELKRMLDKESSKETPKEG